MREVTAGTALQRHRGRLLEHAVDAVADPHLLVAGLEVDVGRAALDGLLDHPVHELDDRRVLAAGAEDDRRVLGEVVQRARGRRVAASICDDVGVVLVLEVGRDGAVAEVGVLEALEQLLDVGGRGDRRAHLVAGHHRDVVDGEHVGRVDHRDQQRALAGEGDGHRLVALDGGGRDELGRVGVDAVDGEVEVVEAEALGDGARELVVGDGAVGDEQPLGRGAVAVGALDRLVDLAARDEVQLDDHVREHASGTAAPGRRGDAVALLGPLGVRWCPGLCWRIHVLAIAPTASRIACRGAVRPVQRSNDAAPWATRISRPSITSAPRVLAASRSRVPPSR